MGQLPYLKGNCPYVIMQCKKGITVRSTGEIVPCGQCISCRLNKGRLWTARILMEWFTHYEETGQRAHFLTFTHADEHLPLVLDTDGCPVSTLEKQKFRNWISNIQRETGPFRYYAVGEYGDESGRAHYHMAVFPTSAAQVREIADRWPKGFTTVSEMLPQRARYLAAYTVKKLTHPDDKRLGNREPEFRISSKNPPLGAAFVQRLVESYRRPSGQAEIEERGDIRRSFRLGGRIYPIGGWALEKARKELGIPLLDRERRLHPRYEDYFSGESAIWDPEESDKLKEQISAKKKQRQYRSTVQRI